LNCRHCDHPLTFPFLDLGFAPPSNAYLSHADLARPERHYPLKLFVCDACRLVQTEDYAARETLFDADYAYFSSVSESWLAHARHYASSVIEELSLGRDSFVIEVASNDGYLLRNFVSAQIPCLGSARQSGRAGIFWRAASALTGCVRPPGRPDHRQ
jgi:hypothetical protein